MSKFRKERLSLDEIMGWMRASYTGPGEFWIKYDPKVKPQYRIIRQQSHDGTQFFTNELFYTAMDPLFQRTSYFTPEPPKEGMRPIYTIGVIRLVTVHGMVDVPAGRFPGQRERLVIPVRVEWEPIPAKADLDTVTEDDAWIGEVPIHSDTTICAEKYIALTEAAEAMLDVLDEYPEQLVPINRKSATVKRLREALASAVKSTQQK
jgi:hypothetical protein